MTWRVCEEEADAPVVDAGVVAGDGEVACAGIAQGGDEGFGDAAEAEAADGQQHVVADDVGEGGAGVGIEFVEAVRGVLEVATRVLFPLDGFEEGFEVAFAEAAASLPLDDLVEDGGAVFYGLGEDLQHVAFVVAVDEDAEALELVEGLVDLADAVLELGVVGVRDGEEVDALLLEGGDGGEDVVRGEGEVLDAGAIVEVEVLLDLGFAAAFGGLVDGELYVAG